MTSKRTRSNQKVHFGEDQEHLHHDAPRTEEELQASFYTSEQYAEMRCHAYGLAKTSQLLGDCTRFGSLNGNSLRGLEKLTGAAETSPKRRRNIVRSIVELHNMERHGSNLENAETIKKTLRKYVQKHIQKASKAAKDRAVQDANEAYKIYYENKMATLLDGAQEISKVSIMVPASAIAA